MKVSKELHMPASACLSSHAEDAGVGAEGHIGSTRLSKH